MKKNTKSASRRLILLLEQKRSPGTFGSRVLGKGADGDGEIGGSGEVRCGESFSGDSLDAGKGGESPGTCNRNGWSRSGGRNPALHGDREGTGSCDGCRMGGGDQCGNGKG